MKSSVIDAESIVALEERARVRERHREFNFLFRNEGRSVCGKTEERKRKKEISASLDEMTANQIT